MKALRTQLLFFLLPLLSILLGACATDPEKLWLRAPDWSRAVNVGVTRTADPVPVAVDLVGNVYLFFFQAGEDGSQGRIHAISPSGEPLWNQSYPELALEIPSQPQLTFDGTFLNLFWRMDNGLYHAMVDLDGDIQHGSTRLSHEFLVENYDTSVHPDGVVTAWWAGSEDAPGLYALPDVQKPGAVIEIDPLGLNPKIQFDSAGDLHAVWARLAGLQADQRFYYREYEDGRIRAGGANTIARPASPGITVLEGPHLGQDKTNIYVFWSLTFFSGEEAGTARTEYIVVPKGDPHSRSDVRVLTIPFSHELPYRREIAGILEAGRRVPFGPGAFGDEQYITQINPNPNPADELVVAFHSRVGYLMRKVVSQVNAMYFLNGGTLGYQQLSFTASGSSIPMITSGPAGDLYLTWLEKGNQFGWAIYFASTSPTLKDGLKDLTRDDLGRLSADTIFGLVAGAVLIPLALAWALPTLIAVLIITRIRRSRESFTDPMSWVTVGVALMVLWIVKIGVLPGMLDYVPFSAWLSIIPETWSSPLRVGVPMLIAILSLIGAAWLTPKDDESPLLKFIIIYIVIDGLLTMAVYGVLIYAAV